MATPTLAQLVTKAKKDLLDADATLAQLNRDLVSGTAAIREMEKRRAQLKTRLESLQALKQEAK